MSNTSPRTIRTQYFANGKLVRTIQAVYPDSAVVNCVTHMQLNSYSADSAEVYDSVTGELHAQVSRKKKGDLNVHYERDPLEFNRPMRRSALALIG